MRGSVWHIFNCPPSTWFCLLSLLYQNRFHKSNQLTGNCPANHNPLLMVRPSSNKDRVDSPHLLIIDLCGIHHSSRTRHNKPLFSPVNGSIVKLCCNCHAYGIQCISTTDENKKFHYLNNMGVNGLGLKIKTCFSTTVKYFHAWSIHFFLGPHLLSPKLISCLLYTSPSPRD